MSFYTYSLASHAATGRNIVARQHQFLAPESLGKRSADLWEHGLTGSSAQGRFVSGVLAGGTWASHVATRYAEPATWVGDCVLGTTRLRQRSEPWRAPGPVDACNNLRLRRLDDMGVLNYATRGIVDAVAVGLGAVISLGVVVAGVVLLSKNDSGRKIDTTFIKDAGAWLAAKNTDWVHWLLTPVCNGVALGAAQVNVLGKGLLAATAFGVGALAGVAVGVYWALAPSRPSAAPEPAASAKSADIPNCTPLQRERVSAAWDTLRGDTRNLFKDPIRLPCGHRTDRADISKKEQRAAARQKRQHPDWKRELICSEVGCEESLPSAKSAPTDGPCLRLVQALNQDLPFGPTAADDGAIAQFSQSHGALLDEVMGAAADPASSASTDATRQPDETSAFATAPQLGTSVPLLAAMTVIYGALAAVAVGRTKGRKAQE